MYDSGFMTRIKNLDLIKNKGIFRKEARALEKIAIEENNPFMAYILAYRLHSKNIRTSKLENVICKYAGRGWYRSPFYIILYAINIRGANILKLQSAILKKGRIQDIAEFGAKVKGADKILIENKIVQSNNPAAAYIYLTKVKSCNINKLKPILMRTKRPRYLYALAKVLKNKKELDQIQDKIIAANSDMYVRLYAQHIPSADIQRLEDRMVKSRNIVEMKRFAAAIKSERIEKMLLLL